MVTRKSSYINLVNDNSIYSLNSTNFDIALNFNIYNETLRHQVFEDLDKYVDIAFYLVTLSYEV